MVKIGKVLYKTQKHFLKLSSTSFELLDELHSVAKIYAFMFDSRLFKKPHIWCALQNNPQKSM